MKHLLQMLARKAMTATLWQTLFVLSVIWGFYGMHMTESTMMQKMRFMAMDSRNTYYLDNVGSYDDSNKIHAEISRMAAETIFNRSPEGLENQERVSRLFEEKIASYLINKSGTDAEAFRIGKVHQHIETGDITQIRVDNNNTKLSVEGLVIRQFELNNRVQTDSKRVVLFLSLSENPHMDTNGMYPLIVKNYEVRYQ